MSNAPRVVASFIREGTTDLRLVFTGARYELQYLHDAGDPEEMAWVVKEDDRFDLLASCLDPGAGEP